MKGRFYNLINISQEQAALVRKRFPNVHVRRTVHKYYMEENPRAMRFLQNDKRAKTGVRYGSKFKKNAGRV